MKKAEKLILNLFSKIELIILMLIFIISCFKSNYSNAADTTTSTTQTSKKDVYVQYSSHVQDIGWEKDFSRSNGITSGTTGKNKKIEAVKIKLVNAEKDVGITYQTYLKGKGWQNWVKDGEISGTTGQNRKMEGIKIKLTSTQDYTVEYRVHVQDIGWMNWIKEGQLAGVIDKGLKIEAIEIRIIPKTMTVVYQTHIQDIAWTKFIKNGETSGTAGSNLKIEAIKIEIRNAENINISYQTHIQDIGWEKTWKKNGEISGTTGQNKKIEAIKIKLEQPTEKYSIMYRSYVQGIGWQDWVQNGNISGTTGKNKRIEAIEIKIKDNLSNKDFSLTYSTHVQDIGWTPFKDQGTISGTTGQNKKVEAIKINLKQLTGVENFTIKYKSYIQGTGWQDWVDNEKISGTTGKNLKMEGIKIKLEGTEKYSIAYRTHIQDIGWQDWANDGETSGLIGKNKKIEAIEIKIIPKISNRTMMYIDVSPSTYTTKSKIKIAGWYMTDVPETKLNVLINNKESTLTQITRRERQDVINTIKGYGGEEKNPKPGFEITIDFTKAEVGKQNIKVQILDKTGKVLKQVEYNTTICNEIETSEGVYGVTALKSVGRGGSDLRYLKFGSGENVFFATFALHAYEDLWAKDGQELINIANTFYSTLKKNNDYEIANKWTIYIFPGINLDGLTNGFTKDGPGRTTLYSKAPGNKGIDLNRCWQLENTTYKKFTTNRNYNGTAPFQAPEAEYLRKFLLEHKSKTGQTILVDLHGWTQQVIGDPGICSYYSQYFPENDKSSVGKYQIGYLMSWAKDSLGSTNKPARSALIELPHEGVKNHQSVVDKNFANRYINATIKMLKSI